MNTNESTTQKATNQSYNTSVKISFPDEEKFFTKEEMAFLTTNYNDMISFMDNGMPFVNYNTAKTVFETVMGNNYNLEILSYEYLKDYNVFLVHLRISLFRRGKTVIKDVIGSETCKKKKDSDELLNFENLCKSAVKDGFKKFLTDYIGIGSTLYHAEKKKYEASFKNKKSYSSMPNVPSSYSCSDCGTNIDQKVHYYSTTVHPQKRPLCQTCQSKYR